MMRRPFLVSMVGWLCILGSCRVLFGSFALLNSASFWAELHRVHVDAHLQLGVILVFNLLLVATGIFIIEGANWSRLVYLGITAAWCMYIMTTRSNWVDLLPAGIECLISALILYLPRSNRFFHRHTRPVWK